MHILDVWESEQAFMRSFEERIGPAVTGVGIRGRPDVKYFPTHGIFAPGLGLQKQTPTI
jgi:hypothetical protein